MLKIGEFSKLSRVSVRMLRHYDEIGLLKPAQIDPFTDYRYYSEDQLPTVFRIAGLRELGFSLADVGKILEVYDDGEKMEEFYAARQRELQEIAADTARKLTLLDAARKRLRKEGTMNTVTIKTIPARYAATVRMIVPRYENEGMLWGVLMEETCRMGLQEDDPCLCAVTYLDGEYKEENVDMMAWKTVRGQYPDTDHVKFLTLPEVTVASCVHRGSYTLIGEVYAAVAAWMEANGYASAGPMFNIYHVSPHETRNPEEFVTEVCYPVRKK